MKIHKQLYRGFLDILFPPICIGCDQRLSSLEKAICKLCWSNIPPTNLGNWKNRVTVHTDLDCVFAGWFLNDVFQKIIHELKYKKKRIVAIELGYCLADLFRDRFLKMNLDFVVPVPLHSVRLRERGFNQSDLIGSVFSTHLGIAYNPKLLRRKKNTLSQTKLSVEDRIENVGNAFWAKDLSQHKRFLIIDDVLTTGATLSSCAKALRCRGAEYIAVAVTGTPEIYIPGFE